MENSTSKQCQNPSCEQPLTGRQRSFCSRSCRNKIHKSKRPAATRKTCRSCGASIKRQSEFCRACYERSRNPEGAVLRRCANPQCARPEDLIRVTPSRAARTERSFHRDCLSVGLSGLRKGKPLRRQGGVLFCRRCGRSLGYKPPSYLRSHQGYCWECGCAVRGEKRKHPRVRVECRRCKTLFWVLPAHRTSLFPHVYCSQACAVAHRESRRKWHRCEAAGCTQRVYYSATGTRVPKFCSHQCRNQMANATKATDAEQRVRQAWLSGVRGWRHVARAAGASTKTVGKVLTRDEIGSDRCPGCVICRG